MLKGQKLAGFMFRCSECKRVKNYKEKAPRVELICQDCWAK